MILCKYLSSSYIIYLWSASGYCYDEVANFINLKIPENYLNLSETLFSMTFAETLTQIKDIVVIGFLLFAFVLMVLSSVLAILLYKRASRFMDRMENVAGNLESTFDRLTIAREAVKDAVLTLRPIAGAIGLLRMVQGLERMFGKPGDDSKAK